MEEEKKWISAKNKKTGKGYWILEQSLINATNSAGKQVMVLYQQDYSPYEMFVREKEEFKEKFDIIW
jgi:hypothetical protein